MPSEQLIGWLTDRSLNWGLRQIDFPWDVHWLLRHATVACYRVHAEVAILERVCLLVKARGTFPRQEPTQKTVLFQGELATYVALSGCESAKRCFLPLFMEQRLLHTLAVQAVSQLVHVVFEEDHV